MRFLVVDDSSVDRHLLSSLLHELGHETEVCDDPRNAMGKIVTEKFDAVFLDIVMPEQDGYKLLRELRSNPETSEQHVIICSNKKTALEINYGVKRAGANDYITKPVSREAITQVLQKI